MNKPLSIKAFRICTRCGQNHFYTTKQCFDCRVKQREWILKHKKDPELWDKVLQRQRDWANANRIRLREYKRKYKGKVKLKLESEGQRPTPFDKSTHPIYSKLVKLLFLAMRK